MALLTLMYEYTSTFTQTGLKNKIQIQNHEKLLKNMENLLLLLPPQPESVGSHTVIAEHS